MYARLLLLASLAFLAACSDSSGAAADPPTARPVRTTPVRAGAADTVLHTVGVLGPKNRIRLAFKTGGVVADIGVDAGDTVTGGQLLAQLDSTEVDAAVARAAEADEKARRDLARAQKLYDDEVATKEQVEDLATAASIARANLGEARFNARYTRIVAPGDGMVMRRLAEPGELVAAGAPVLVVGDLDGGWVVRVAVADRDVVRLAAGDTAELAFDAFPGARYPAHVQRVESSSDPRTGTYEVELAVDAGNPGFVEGLIAKVDLAPGGESRTRLWVPVQALLEADGDRANVFVLDADGERVTLRRIRLGEIAGDRVEVRDGLAPGERVVSEGAAWLEDGAAVRVLARADEED